MKARGEYGSRQFLRAQISGVFMKTKTGIGITAAILSAVLMMGCAGPGKDTGETEAAAQVSKELSLEEQLAADSGEVALMVWGAEEDQALLEQIIDGFLNEYQGQARFQITLAVQSESGCKDALMSDLEAGADVFAFADDQLNTLVAAGALEPIVHPQQIRADNLEGAVEAASVDDTLYAYPLTADNGYFLYYNKQYITESDAASLDKILEAAAAHQKKFAMDWSSGWYVYSFFGNTGLEVGLNEDGITNYCTWNQTGNVASGREVAQAMLEIAASPGFLNTDDGGFLRGVQNGSVIAGVSGVWNAVAVEKAWGNQYAAARLPTYTCADRQIQMASFSGYKLIGVNAYSEHPAWAALLAEWISNESNQQLRFTLRGQGPSNLKASRSAAVQDSPAIAALLAQSEYSCLQRIGGNYWDPVSEFAGTIAEGNPDHIGLQELLDTMAEGIMAP